MLQQKAGALADCLRGSIWLLASTGDGNASPVTLDAACKCLAVDLPAHLQALGGSLVAALPQRLCCNHPACSSLDKVSEAVAAAAVACPRCGAAYCSKACYRDHWKQHKAACKLAASSAGAAAAGTKKAHDR
jgi:hypothetical protein